MAEWIEPKTDWYSGDYFNAEDYNRIIGNITFLKTYLDSMYQGLSDVSFGDEKTYESLIYAREINAIEDALDKLNVETYNLPIGEKNTYKANKPTPLWSEYNRIENAIMLIYNTMVAQKNALPKLSFKLGNRKGIRV